MRQRALKQKADQRGLLLRPQDPNSASSIGKKSSGKPSGLRAGSNKRQAARPGANPLLAAGGRGGDGGDPLAKKVKVRLDEKSYSILWGRCGWEGEEGSRRRGNTGVRKRQGVDWRYRCRQRAYRVVACRCYIGFALVGVGFTAWQRHPSPAFAPHRHRHRHLNESSGNNSYEGKRP